MLITILNIYNPVNNIKFTKVKKSKKKKIHLVLDFLKVKYYKKKEKKKINHSTIYNLNTNYYFKFL